MNDSERKLELIESYKEYLRETRNKDENYKWEAIDHFQSNWNIDSEDFSGMFLESFKKQKNLFHQYSWDFISKAVKNYPEEVRKMFRSLYNEDEPLKSRLEEFKEEAETLLPEVRRAVGNEKMKANQDERTLSVYLAFRYPGSYYIYMNNFYVSYCGCLDIDNKPANEKYLHYKELADDLRKNYVAVDNELMDLHRKLFPDLKWNQNHLITQNLLFVTLEKGSIKKPPEDMVKEFFEWFEVTQKKYEDFYASTISFETLSKLGREQFVEFFFQFAREGGQIQSGGQRTATKFRLTMEEAYDAFRDFILEPFGDNFKEDDWLIKTNEFKWFGQGLASIFLNRIDKKRFAIINNKAIEAVKLLGADVPNALNMKYKAIKKVWMQLIDFYPEFDNFYRTDALSQFLIGEKIGEKWISYFRSNDKLIFPFNKMFNSYAEADNAFELLGKGMGILNLGVNDESNPAVSCTFPIQREKRIIRINYGKWAVLALVSDAENRLMFQYACREDLLPEGYQKKEKESFKDMIDGYKYYLVSIPIHHADEPEFNESLEESLNGVNRLFSSWTGSPYKIHHRPEIYKAIFDEKHRKALLKKGLEGGGNRYWIFAPGEEARFWEEFRQNGLIAIGWNSLTEDLSACNTEEDIEAIHKKWYGKDASEQSIRMLFDFVVNMQDGDVVIVKEGKKVLLGMGEVVSPYYYDEKRAEYRHLRKVSWTKTGRWELPEGLTEFPVKTLTGISDKKRIDELKRLMEGAMPGFFSNRSFELLAALHERPEASFYQEHLQDFKSFVENPLQELMNQVAQKLPDQVLEVMETEKRVFAQIRKNDYGKGGAWPFYWGAFYPRGGKRISDPQLFLGIHQGFLHFGFYIGEYGLESRQRFEDNHNKHKDHIKRLLESFLDNPAFIFGSDSDEEEKAGKFLIKKIEPSWSDWLDDLKRYGFRVAVKLDPHEAIQISRIDLVDRVSDAFKRLFPLILLASSEQPIEEIQRYKEILHGEGEVINQEYSLDQLSQETFLPASDLKRWVNALKAKKQAIFYGPPGTGKTFVAERIAKHLIGGGDGFSEILQFHPSYAYEDFMQGLRPKALKDGGLEYSMVPGRFKDFCLRASGCKDACVLVIDEINRANLARVFGELMYLLEYREKSIPLSGGEHFRIPKNVLLIGTMNTADRSIALVDHALRRRFAFIALYPKYEILSKFYEGKDFNPEGLISVLKRINSAINDPHFEIGVSFFMKDDIKSRIQDAWQMEIEPYIQELFFDQLVKAEVFAWGKIKNEILLS